MIEIRSLARLVYRQLMLRSVLWTAFTTVLVGFFLLLQSAGNNPLFEFFPWLLPLAKFVKSLHPWNVFVIAFVVLNLWEYVRMFQETFVERLNLRTLVNRSLVELADSADPMTGLAARRATLNARRRLLEHIIRFLPAEITLAVFGLIEVLLGYPLAGFAYWLLGIACLVLLPRFISKFDRRREELHERAQAFPPLPRGTEAIVRAESKINETGARARILVDRNLEKLRVTWPVVPLLIGAVVIASIAVISGMAATIGADQRSTLLIVLLVLGARLAVTAVQQQQEVAFFASAVHQLDSGDSGLESL